MGRVAITNKIVELLQAGVSDLQAVYDMPIEFVIKPVYPCASVWVGNANIYKNIGTQRHSRYEVTVDVFSNPIMRADLARPNLQNLLEDVENLFTSESALSNDVFQIVGDQNGPLIQTEQGMLLVSEGNNPARVWYGSITFTVYVDG